MYLALIGDIINSKQILERETFQQSFQQLMTELSDVYGEELISPFTITAGDEFQALLKPSKKVFQIIDHIQLALKPVNVRFGLGTGNIITSINLNESIGADGPAYWHARSAINHIHDKNDYGTVQVAICLDDEDQNLELTLNSLISAGDFIKSKWTTNHFQMLEHLILQDNYQEQFQHQKLAQLENIEPSALTKRLKASGLKIYLRTRTQAADLLVKSCTQTKGGSYDF